MTATHKTHRSSVTVFIVSSLIGFLFSLYVIWVEDLWYDPERNSIIILVTLIFGGLWTYVLHEGNKDTDHKPSQETDTPQESSVMTSDVTEPLIPNSTNINNTYKPTRRLPEVPVSLDDFVEADRKFTIFARTLEERGESDVFISSHRLNCTREEMRFHLWTYIAWLGQTHQIRSTEELDFYHKGFFYLGTFIDRDVFFVDKLNEKFHQLDFDDPDYNYYYWSDLSHSVKQDLYEEFEREIHRYLPWLNHK